MIARLTDRPPQRQTSGNEDGNGDESEQKVDVNVRWSSESCSKMRIRRLSTESRTLENSKNMLSCHTTFHQNIYTCDTFGR